MSISILSQHKIFGGQQLFCQHASSVTQSDMRFGIFLPPQSQRSLPALYWLSGLTCTEENFIIKAGAQRVAAELGIVLISPDTSPRVNLSHENIAYDFGPGASFYVDATQPPWQQHYRMYEYLAVELPLLITQQFPVDAERVGIFGHSMGGHGALTIAIKNPEIFRTVSAFAPICSPTRCPWGIKALTGYLGADRAEWEAYDSTTLLLRYGWSGPEILVDQGTEDPYLQDQLKPALLQEACEKAHVKLNLRMQKGYDHSYFFVATFIADHLRYHFNYLHDTTKPV